MQAQIEILPIKKKLEIIDYAKTFGRNVAAKKYDLAGSTITYWTKIEENLKEQKIKASKIEIHKGPTLNTMILRII